MIRHSVRTSTWSRIAFNQHNCAANDITYFENVQAFGCVGKLLSKPLKNKLVNVACVVYKASARCQLVLDNNSCILEVYVSKLCYVYARYESTMLTEIMLHDVDVTSKFSGLWHTCSVQVNGAAQNSSRIRYSVKLVTLAWAGPRK